MTAEFRKLRPKAQLYIALVVLAGVSVISTSIYQLIVEPIGFEWLILAGLTLLTGSFNIKVSSINVYISVSEAFVFASILLFGVPAGTATVLIECMVILLWMKRETRTLHRVLFNIAAPSVAVWTAGTAFYLLSGIEPYAQKSTPLPTLFIPLLAFTALYFLLNSWLVAIAIGLEKNVSATRIWRQNFAWLSVNYFSGASLAALIVTYTKQLDYSTFIIIIPLLGVCYLTFRTAMGRSEDSYSHLAELNRLYLSTIETLAMAIDAKDQITHGHIRRVQMYAVGLAKQIGVSDERLLKAIEAAALLHDMGKLAVPEYILNKPGKLTAAEFEKMKLHASVGADILSAIEFPYPVVPIVRHHHENWDGTGYPTGLRGTDIPIGARILSVVDCFDALTSDRPYRAKLSDQAAIDILLNRRGNMYDPLVVDTFIRVHKEIAPEPATQIVPSVKELAVASVAQETKPEHQRENGETIVESTAVVALRRALVGPSSLGDTGDVIGKHLRAVVPFSLGILYVYDVAHDELVARHVSGDAQRQVKEFRLSLGERLSGWVAANRQTILNSDPVLDLADLAEGVTTGLKTTLSVPLLADNDLVGVLALYSTADVFTEEHRRIVEAASQFIARTIKQQSNRPRLEERDSLTGLPMTTNLPAVLSHISEDLPRDRSVSLLFIDIVKLAEINRTHGRSVGDQVLLQVVQAAQACLSNGDVLFRHTDDEFVALLADSDVAATSIVAKRLRNAVRIGRSNGNDNDSFAVLLSTHTISVASDSPSLRRLFGTDFVPVEVKPSGIANRVH